MSTKTPPAPPAIAGPAAVLLLTTTSRHTGRLRTAPLIYHRDGERLVVCAESLAGCPYACIQVGSAIRAVRARPATAEEVERYSPALARSRPMYVLEPLGDPVPELRSAPAPGPQA
jgi:uncharacterized DUF497 family protein